MAIDRRLVIASKGRKKAKKAAKKRAKKLASKALAKPAKKLASKALAKPAKKLASKALAKSAKKLASKAVAAPAKKPASKAVVKAASLAAQKVAERAALEAAKIAEVKRQREQQRRAAKRKERKAAELEAAKIAEAKRQRANERRAAKRKERKAAELEARKAAELAARLAAEKAALEVAEKLQQARDKIARLERKALRLEHKARKLAKTRKKEYRQLRAQIELAGLQSNKELRVLTRELRGAQDEARRAVLRAAVRVYFEKREQEAAAKAARTDAEKTAELELERARKQKLVRVFSSDEAYDKFVAIAEELRRRPLAILLNVTTKTVGRWLSKGIPTEQLPNVSRVITQHEQVVREGKNNWAIFNELLKQAGEFGLVPKYKRRNRRRAGPQTIGWEWSKVYELGVTQSLITEIRAWLLSHRSKTKEWTFWHAVIKVSQYAPPGTSLTKNYQTIVYQMPHDMAWYFVIETTIASHRYTINREKVIGHVRKEHDPHIESPRLLAISELCQLLENAYEAGILMVIHTVSLFNYRWRTEKEQAGYASKQRRARWETQQHYIEVVKKAAGK